MSLQIRRATHQDMQALTDLMHASSAYHGQYAPMLQGYQVKPEQIENDLMYLAELEGEIIGFYSLIVNREPELDLMFVSDAYQGRNIGKLLFEHMRQTAKNHNIPVVKIISNPPAENFYIRMGAIRTGTKAPRGRITWSQPILELHTAPENNS
jgi:GNAT superfamily N-acetyltransferase